MHGKLTHTANIHDSIARAGGGERLSALDTHSHTLAQKETMQAYDACATEIQV